MNIEPAMNRYCRNLSRASSDALQDGLDTADVFQGLLGTIAVSVRQAGGDDHHIAETFRTLADCYEDSERQHCTALREASVRR